MAWDSTRPVPWQRLMREWLFYVAVMVVILLLFLRDRPLVGVFAGLLVSGPLYLAFGFVLAKFGYQRKTLRQLRSEQPSGASDRSRDDQPEIAGPRPKPPPTRRTGGGGRPGGPRKRRR